MSKYYVHKTEWHDDILEHNEYVKENLFAKLNYDQIQTILDYPVGGVGEANQTDGGVLASDMLIAGVETTVIMSMDLKQKLGRMA